MKAYSYRRFSSKAQEAGDSLRRQTEMAQKYCTKHDLELSTETYEDLGVSAWTGGNSDEDAGLGQFLKACEEKKISKDSVLLVENLDRLSRQDIKKALRQLMHITDFVDVITLTDNKRYTNKMDIADFITAIVTMDRANEESELKSQRIRDAWEAKRRDPKNSKKTRKCPFWLDVTEDNLSFEVNSKVEVVELAFKLSAQGLGNLKVSKQLNSYGYKTARQKDWSPAIVCNLLKSRNVIGEYQPCKVVNRKVTPEGEPIRDYYPQVISTELFNKVQLAIADRAKSVRMGSTSSHRNLIKDNGRCMCGGQLFITSKRQGVPYFQCQNALNKSSDCPHGLFRFDVFLQFLREQIIRPIYFNIWATEDNRTGSEIEAIEVKLLDEQKKMDALLGLDVTNPSITAKISEVGKCIAELESNRSDLEKQAARLTLSGSKRQSYESIQQLIDVAGGLDSNTPEIAARVELSRMLGSFKFQLGNLERVSIIRVESYDKNRNKTIIQGFKSLKTPSRAIKKGKDIWKLDKFDIQ
ncbi:recombinase family protein [Vibrio bathopelagicus]